MILGVSSGATRTDGSYTAVPHKAAAMPPPPSVPPEPAAAVETPKVKVFTRRPSVDTGLRYSSNDWLKVALSTPTSFILRRIRFHLLFNVAVALAVVHFYPHYPMLSIPMVGHTLLGSSLGLLLSYRTNSAYARFWEARGYWTKAKATCRNLAINVRAHIEPHSPKSSAHFLELLAAFPSALMHLSLGGAARLPDHVQKLIPEPKDPDQFHDAPSLPAIYLCRQLHNTIHQATVESPSSNTDLVEAAHLTAVSHLIDVLLDCMSSCEKILRTPVPWTYSRHTSRFLTLWMGSLPFALVGTLNPVLTIAVVAAASYCMLGIEEIGHLIEQPFLGDPLEGDDLQVWSIVDDDGEAAELVKRGRKTQPYDIGIPVCSLARQIRNEVKLIAAGKGGEH
jgi:putative membrane protein